MTPEQRKTIVGMTFVSVLRPDERDALRACLAQADKVTPEAEADRRLGAMLRDAVRGFDADVMQRNADYCRKRGNVCDAGLYECGVAALREEATE